MGNDAVGQEKQKDYIIQKANILSFQGPTALFALQQGVWTMSRFLWKGWPASKLSYLGETQAAGERGSERQSREGPRKGELATISHKFSFVLRSDEGKYYWLKNDVPEIKVDQTGLAGLP